MSCVVSHLHLAPPVVPALACSEEAWRRYCALYEEFLRQADQVSTRACNVDSRVLEGGGQSTVIFDSVEGKVGVFGGSKCECYADVRGRVAPVDFGIGVRDCHGRFASKTICGGCNGGCGGSYATSTLSQDGCAISGGGETSSSFETCRGGGVECSSGSGDDVKRINLSTATSNGETDVVDSRDSNVRHSDSSQQFAGVAGDGALDPMEKKRLARVKERERKKRQALVRRVKAQNVTSGASGYFSSLAEDKRESLRESRAQMLEARNLLEAEKAKRQLEDFKAGVISPIQQAKELKAVQQLEVLRAKDLDLEKKRVNTRMLRDAECDKVKIEQSFAKLAVTGNVPHVGGSVKTIVSGATGSLSSGTISPNSSVSMKEIHDMMEELALLREERKEHQEFAQHVKTLHPLIYDTLAPKVREKDKVFPPETEYEPTEGGGFPEHAWDLEENLGMFELEPDNKFRRRPDPEDTGGLIEYHKRRFHQFGIKVPYKSELSFIADNHFGR